MMEEWIRIHRELLKHRRQVSLDEKLYSALNLGLMKEWIEQQQREQDLCGAIRKRLNRVREHLTSIRDGIRDGVSPGNLRESIQTFEERLNATKAYLQSSFESSTDEFTAIDKFLSEFDISLYDYDSNGGESKVERDEEQDARTASNLERSFAVQARVGAIDKELAQLGGRTGHWDSRDHDVFLKVITQLYGGNMSKIRAEGPLIRKLAVALPNKIEEELIIHTAWYNYQPSPCYVVMNFL
jgi:hypothetical protein